MNPRVPTDLSSTSRSVDRDQRLVHRRAAEAVIWGCGLTICFFLATRTALAHEKWFHQGAWEPANWRNLLQFPTAALIAGVVVITILAAIVRRRLARPNVFPGPVALGADAAGITRFYSWAPLILAIHVAVPLLVYGIQGHLFVPYLNLEAVWQYWLGLIQVGAAIALLYGGLTRLASIAIVAGWLIGIGVFGLEPMLENSHYVGFAAFFLLAGRGPFSIDQLLFPRLTPPINMMRLAPSALRIGVGISLVAVAFTEKLANPQLALSFLQQHPLNFTAALGVPMSDATFVLCAGTVELLVGFFVLFGLFPRLVILIAWLPFNLTLTIFDWVELIGHLPFYGAMAFLLVWTPEEGALWIKGLRVRPAPAEGAFDPAA
jgi:uncharacterized membrane protein YphA (DoxX/SURF4 family)